MTGPQTHLDAPVPYISIEPVGRQLKSANARRKIALTGVSLEAMRAFPAGFPRYQTISAGLSATVNKALRAKGLMESPKHVLYSLRHSFEDRMLRHGIDERVRRDLMGHALSRERYGEGASLEYQRGTSGTIRPVSLSDGAGSGKCVLLLFGARKLLLDPLEDRQVTGIQRDELRHGHMGGAQAVNGRRAGHGAGSAR